MMDETEMIDNEYEEELQVQYKAALKKYFLQCLLMEGSKIILFFIIFSYLNLTLPYLVALLFLMAVRCNGGGLHCKHYTTCFLLSLLVLAASIYGGLYLPIYKWTALPLLTICSAVGYLTVPIVSSNRPEPDEKVIQLSKRRTVNIILIYALLICICPYNQYLNIGTWTILIHILQLLCAKFLQRRGRNVQS